MTSTTARRPTLPVSQTVIDAYLSLRTDWRAGQRTFWLSLALSVGGIWLATSFPGEHRLTSAGWALIGLLLMVAILLGLSCTAVALHRLILLGEQPPANWFGIGEPVLPYLGRLLLIFLIAMPIGWLSMLLLLPALPRVLAMSADPLERWIAGAIIFLIVITPALTVVARLSLALPGIATGRPMTLTESWRFTAGNTAQLLGGTILVQVPAYAISEASQLAIRSPTSALMTELFLAVVHSLSIVAGISFLSLSYRFLVRTGAPSQPETS